MAFFETTPIRHTLGQFLWATTFACCSLWSTAQEAGFNTLDSYQTDAAVNCRFALLDGEQWEIYALLDFKEEVTDTLTVHYSWSIGQQVYSDSTFKVPVNNQVVLRWPFEENKVPDLLTVGFNWMGKQWIYQEHFPLSAFHESGGVSLWRSSVPLLDGYIRHGDSVTIKLAGNGPLYAYYYSHKFDPARPPMMVNPVQAGATLAIDSVFTLAPDSIFKPDQMGLYFFQSDSSGTLGVSLLVTDKQFPIPQTINDLTEPLVYITTKDEYQEIEQDFSSKQALDKFWLSTLGSPEKARVAIKKYYQNIEEANQLFTSYKEGWKTDKGMIYTVLGSPLTVTKGIDNEVWTYQSLGGDELIFEFVKIRNIFSNNHYELFRDKSFDRTWFTAIDRWREGRAP